MSDSTPGAAGLPDPGLPGPALPDPELPAAAPVPGGDETVRVPVEPEVAWNAPEPPTPATGLLSAATVGWVAPPPEPSATGKPGWVIASVGARLGAYWLDGLIGGAIFVTALILVVFVAGDQIGTGPLVDIALSVALLGFYFVYFVGFWTSGGKATPGMRVFKLQVANAADGKRLAIGPAVIRWLALGYFFSLFALIQPLSGIAGLAALIWSIVLLVTTANDPMHQGLHDRWAKSVMVRPESATSTGGAWFATCLIFILIIGLLILVPIVALILLGGQVSAILSAVGASI